MSRILLILSLLLSFTILEAKSPLAPRPPVRDLRVMTYNLRYDNPGDSLDNWKYRLPSIATLIELQRPDILGVQEGLHHMLLQLDSSFAKWGNFTRVGVGRDDGKQAGEYSAIYFDTTRFIFRESGYFWLSDTTDRPAFGWDAACIRIATWVRLSDRLCGRNYLVFNTHFDHIGVVAREKSAELIKRRIAALRQDEMVIVMGDFNSSTKDVAYKTLTNATPAPQLLDSRLICTGLPLGPESTYCGFDPKAGIIGERIDFIFVTSPPIVTRYVTFTQYTERQRFLSDHLPVMIDIK